MVRRALHGLLLILMGLSVVAFPFEWFRIRGIPLYVFFISLLIVLSSLKALRKGTTGCLDLKLLTLAVWAVLTSVLLTSFGSVKIDLKDIGTVAVYCLMCICLVVYFDTKDAARQALTVIVVSCGVLGLYGYYGFFTGHIGVETQTDVWRYYARYWGVHYSPSTRNADVHFMVIPLLLSLGLPANIVRSNRLGFLLRHVSVLFFALAIVLSFSRGAWISAVGAIAFFEHCRNKYRMITVNQVATRCLVAALTAGVVIFVMIKMNLLSYFVGKVISIFSTDGSRTYLVEETSNASRLRIIAVSIRIIFSTWFGVGLDNFRYYASKYSLMINHAENFYLNVWAELGILGLFGFIVMWIRPIKVLARYGQITGDTESLALCSVMVYLCLVFLFNVETYNYYIWVVVGLAWSYAVNANRTRSLSEKPG